MSQNERKRMTIMAGVKSGELTQVQAAELMGVSYRQAKRVWRRYQDQGDAGLGHRLRGLAGLPRKPATERAQVRALYADERYADFGPTLLAEELAKSGLGVDHDTVRRWRLAQGKRTGNGGNANRASGRCCNWTARTTTGLKGGGPSAG